MLYDITDPKFRAAVLAFMLARKAAARRADLESEIDRVKRRMEQRRIHAMSQLVLYSCAADESSERRHVQRNSGKWRGSTISGYLRGDDQTYVENFRMNSVTFDKLLALLEHTSFATAESPPVTVGLRAKAKRRSASHIAFARAHVDPPTTRFKLAVCLYAMAHGGRFKQVGDAAGIGKSTVRQYMVAFCEGVMAAVKPIYMRRKLLTCV